MTLANLKLSIVATATTTTTTATIIKIITTNDINFNWRAQLCQKVIAGNADDVVQPRLRLKRTLKFETMKLH